MLFRFSAIALACAVAVQGATLVERSTNGELLLPAASSYPDSHFSPAATCPNYVDPTPPHCETTGGSPRFIDCQTAVKQLEARGDRCKQTNTGFGSGCKTLVTVGTCKIDVCGKGDAQVADGVSCGGMLRTILNRCRSNDLVGGYLEPLECKVVDNGHPYKVQFSHI